MYPRAKRVSAFTTVGFLNMKNYIQVILLLLLPLMAVVLYSHFADTWNVRLEKIHLDEDRAVGGDTLALQPAGEALAEANTIRIDTARQRILFLGDSMVEGLGPRMGEYCAANGHDLTYVCWYSSTSLAWASDTLRHYLNALRPTFVIMTLGGNEQQTRDTERRKECVSKMVAAVGNVPMIWIATPAWNTDATFNAIPRSVVGERRFFDSDRLTLERAADHKHPTFAAARTWMDSIATWMSSGATAHPIRMDVPPKGTAAKYRGIYLRPKAGGEYVHEERIVGGTGSARQAAAPGTVSAPAKPAPAAAAPVPAAPRPAATPSQVAPAAMPATPPAVPAGEGA